jgi:PPOX class probable F420-dependent enzyme
VARLATLRADGTPHLVPVVFAISGDTLYTAVDRKPKRGSRLQRLDNIRGNPAVSILIDHYQEDWTKLWWVRIDGRAQLEEGEVEEAIALLRSKYRQYAKEPPPGPVIEVDIETVVGWSASWEDPAEIPTRR